MTEMGKSMAVPKVLLVNYHHASLVRLSCLLIRTRNWVETLEFLTKNICPMLLTSGHTAMHVATA